MTTKTKTTITTKHQQQVHEEKPTSTSARTTYGCYRHFYVAADSLHCSNCGVASCKECARGSFKKCSGRDCDAWVCGDCSACEDCVEEMKEKKRAAAKKCSNDSKKKAAKQKK